MSSPDAARRTKLIFTSMGVEEPEGLRPRGLADVRLGSGVAEALRRLERGADTGEVAGMATGPGTETGRTRC